MRKNLKMMINLNLVVDLNADKTKIYNGLSPTKIPEDTYPYGAIFARNEDNNLWLNYIQNLLDDRIMYNYVDSDTLDEIEFDSKWIYVLEPDEFIVPDVWENQVATLANAAKWSNIELPPGVKKVAVVQAINFDEAAHCYSMLRDLGYHKIAFSYGAEYYNKIVVLFICQEK